jgi:hypothetical protein
MLCDLLVCLINKLQKFNSISYQSKNFKTDREKATEWDRENPVNTNTNTNLFPILNKKRNILINNIFNLVHLILMYKNEFSFTLNVVICLLSY